MVFPHFVLSPNRFTNDVQSLVQLSIRNHRSQFALAKFFHVILQVYAIHFSVSREGPRVCGGWSLDLQ